MWRRRPSFIGGKEGIIWKMIHPLMEGTKPTSRYVEPMLHPMNRPWRGGMNRPGNVELGCGRTLGGPPWVQFYWVASSDLLDLGHGGVAKSWVGFVRFWACSPLVQGPDFLGCGPPSPLAHVGMCIVVFLVYFRYISCVILTCPDAKEQTPKLVESVSFKALFLGLVSLF